MEDLPKIAKLTGQVAAKERFVLVVLIILFTDLTIFLDIPLIRPLLGVLFLTLLPGSLVLQILKLNKMEFTEKFVLSVGLSISFLMFFGLLLNEISLGLGYKRPLSTISLLISFNIIFIVLGIIGYCINKNSVFSLPNLNLKTSEKTFLVVPILFPALSIFGTHVMNATCNNTILMFLLFLIIIYVIFICFSNYEFPKRLYPIVIFLISISLLLMFALRSSHIIGVDKHLEYYLFQTTLNNLHWNIRGHSTLDACLSISLLPTIYQSVLNGSEEYLSKLLYPLTISILPLVIYLLSKKYIEEIYAFLASFFFMSQYMFVFQGDGRTFIAIMFFALSVMILFSEGINPLNKKLLFIVFTTSIIISHYSTTYIFFFIMLGSFLTLAIPSKRYNFKISITSVTIILFFATLFFWYSQIIEAPFYAGVSFIKDALITLHEFFIYESRSIPTQKIIGMNIMQETISFQIEWVLTWITFVFIAIGIFATIKRYKEMISIPGIKSSRPTFLKKKLKIEYVVIASMCSGLLVLMVALPHLSKGYNLNRLYDMMMVILSLFFILGGLILSKFLKVHAHIIILIILIPYFLCVSGPIHNLLGYPRAITLNSEGKFYDMYYVHDQECYSAKWLKENNASTLRVYTDHFGTIRLESQGKFSPSSLDRHSLQKHKKVGGYIYLRYYNVVNSEFLTTNYSSYDINEYDDVFIRKGKIYDNGGSEIYR